MRLGLWLFYFRDVPVYRYPLLRSTCTRQLEYGTIYRYGARLRYMCKMSTGTCTWRVVRLKLKDHNFSPGTDIFPQIPFRFLLYLALTSFISSLVASSVLSLQWFSVFAFSRLLLFLFFLLKVAHRCLAFLFRRIILSDTLLMSLLTPPAYCSAILSLYL
jgi:hypothetical protein